MKNEPLQRYCDAKTWRGLAYAFVACACWSTLYIRPDFIAPYGPADLVVMRFAISGAFAAAILMFRGRCGRKLADYSRQQWLAASGLGFLGFSGYYFFLATAIKYTSEFITVAIIAMISVITLVINNIVYREHTWKEILAPGLVGLAGLATIIAHQIHTHQFAVSKSSGYAGLAAAAIALAMWSAYQVLNRYALDRYSDVSTTDWSLLTLIGSAATLPLLIAVLPVSPALIQRPIQPAFYALLAWAALLSVGASLLSLFAWNIAQKNLPPALSGQSIAFLLPLVFALSWHYGRFDSSPWVAALGIVLLLASVAMTATLKNRRPVVETDSRD